jgi:hypothetical protein
MVSHRCPYPADAIRFRNVRVLPITATQFAVEAWIEKE